MFTILAQNDQKILVGNRRGKVFAANRAWLDRCPHIWQEPVYVDQSVIRIPVAAPAQMLSDELDPFAPTKVQYDVYKLRCWRYGNTDLMTCCAFNRYLWRWYLHEYEPKEQARQ
jgi:hypothetical protein